VTGEHNAEYAGKARMTARAATAALAAILLVSAAWANGQRSTSAPRPQSTPYQATGPKARTGMAGNFKETMGSVRLPAIPEALHDPVIQVTLGRATLVR